MPKLIVSLPDGSAVTHELAEATISVGRLQDNTLQIEDASVSSHHAELTLGDGGDYVLTDIGSTNGTLLNGKEMAEGEGQRLQAGDKVIFGNIETSYESENPAEARAMPAAKEMAAVTASKSEAAWTAIARRQCRVSPATTIRRTGLSTMSWRASGPARPVANTCAAIGIQSCSRRNSRTCRG